MKQLSVAMEDDHYVKTLPEDIDVFEAIQSASHGCRSDGGFAVERIRPG
jgi:hypothetical protein